MIISCDLLKDQRYKLIEAGDMPRKIRELKQLLRQVGFTELPGKESHTNWVHSLYAGKITVSGKDGADAKRYQESEILAAIEIVKGSQQDE
jgi:predicted RNA binding protein YcfA (HicA-like mRNA interferase family)